MRKQNWWVCIKETSNMRYVSVKTFPDAKREHVEKTGEDAYEMYVREAPMRNMANRRVRILVALQYDVPEERVRIVTGHKSPNKRLMIS